MKQSEVSRSLVLFFKPTNSINLLFDENYFIDHNIINKNEILDVELDQEGKFIEIQLKNPNRSFGVDYILITSEELTINFFEPGKTLKIFDQIKPFIKNLEIENCEYQHDVHLDDEKYPKVVFNKLYDFSKEFSYEVIGLKSKQIEFFIFSCKDQRIHIKARNTIASTLIDKISNKTLMTDIIEEKIEKLINSGLFDIKL